MAIKNKFGDYFSHSFDMVLQSIHMNGRVYNPTLARFVSADPLISNPDDTQNYNRYSYVHNRPMFFTDPSGFAARRMGKDEDADCANARDPACYGGDSQEGIAKKRKHASAQVLAEVAARPDVSETEADNSIDIDKKDLDLKGVFSGADGNLTGIEVKPEHTNNVTQNPLSEDEETQRLKLMRKFNIWSEGEDDELIREAALSVKDYLLTDEGYRTVKNYTGIISVEACVGFTPGTNGTRGAMKFNVDGNNGYVKGADGTYIKLTTFRVFSHEMRHIYMEHKPRADDPVYERSAMRFENKILKQHRLRMGQGSLFVERVGYDSFSKDKLPIGASIR